MSKNIKNGVSSAKKHFQKHRTKIAFPKHATAHLPVVAKESSVVAAAAATVAAAAGWMMMKMKMMDMGFCDYYDDR